MPGRRLLKKLQKKRATKLLDHTYARSMPEGMETNRSNEDNKVKIPQLPKREEPKPLVNNPGIKDLETEKETKEIPLDFESAITKHTVIKPEFEKRREDEKQRKTIALAGKPPASESTTIALAGKPPASESIALAGKPPDESKTITLSGKPPASESKTIALAGKPPASESTTIALAGKPPASESKTIALAGKPPGSDSKTIALAGKTPATESKTITLSVKPPASESKTIALAGKPPASESKTITLSVKPPASESKTIALAGKPPASESKTIALAGKPPASESTTIALVGEPPAGESKTIALAGKPPASDSKTIALAGKTPATESKTIALAGKPPASESKTIALAGKPPTSESKTIWLAAKPPTSKNRERIKTEHMKRGIINCHCGYRGHKSLMVQCDLCLCWQHAACHNMQRECDVPLKYKCSICLNPPRGRRSQRFLHDQDPMYEGRLPGGKQCGKSCDILRRSHELTGTLMKILAEIRALKFQQHFACLSKKNREPETREQKAERLREWSAYMRRYETDINARLDFIETQIEELEALSPSDMDVPLDDRRIKETIQMLLRDLAIMEELGRIT